MKKILLIISLIFILITSGCIKRDDLEDITIYTTIYPVQYVTERLYGYNSEVLSIYPDGVNPKKYTLTKKQIKDYSKSAIFVYNGLSDEKNIARDFINNNKNIKIIDVSQGININNNVEELWLNPTDYLMLTQNIKNSLKEYISNKYIFLLNIARTYVFSNMCLIRIKYCTMIIHEDIYSCSKNHFQLMFVNKVLFIDFNK